MSKRRYLVAIPSIYPPFTGACVDSLDPRVRKNTVVIDNAGGYNRGVAASWNLVAREVVAKKWDYLVIVSAAMRFNQGLEDFMQELYDKKPVGLDTQFGWHCVALHRYIFESVGFFDENFYPAYYEDSDFIRRMELAEYSFPGVLNPGIPDDQKMPRFQVDAECIEDAHGIKKANVYVNYERNKQYFIKKWGAEPKYDSPADREALYYFPFNNEMLPLDYCEPVDANRFNSVR